jgi:hypothetical protein
LLFGATAALALITIALTGIGFWQARDNKAAIKAAQTSANAAMLHARTAVAAESAEVLVHSINLVEFPDPPPGVPDTIIPGGPAPEYSRIILSVFNSGRTRGEIIRMSLQWGVFVADPADNPPVYQNIVGRTFVVLREQLLSMKWGEGIVHLDDTLRGGVNAGEMTLWIYGFFTYQNFMDQKTDVGFIGRWRSVYGGLAPQPLGFIMGGPPQYNYIRRRSVPGENEDTEQHQNG